MGFLDFLKKGFEIVKDVVVNHQDNPIVKTLSSVASVVAHAVPPVGAVIDAAVPALNAIFSNDTPPPPAVGQVAPPLNPLEQPIMINFKQTQAQINDLIASVNQRSDELQKRIGNIADLVKEQFEELKRQQLHDMYLKFQGELNIALQYFDSHKSALEKLSASSGPQLFIPYFDSGKDSLVTRATQLADEVVRIQTWLTDAAFTPPQDFIDLYLIAVHWLLIFDKVSIGNLKNVIVTRGLRIRCLFVNALFTEYLGELASLEQNINTLLTHAKSALKTSQTLVDDLPQRRFKFIKVVTKDNKISIEDNWGSASIGWVDPGKIALAIEPDKLAYDIEADKALGDANALKTRLEKGSTNVVYRQVVMRYLEGQLQPLQAVTLTLQDNIHQWNSRLPVSPEKLPKGEYHIKAAVLPNGLATSAQVTASVFWEKHLSYAVTYVNSYGESSTSSYYKLGKIEKGLKCILLQLGPIVYAEDPTKGIDPAEPQDPSHSALAAPSKGIRRRVYLSYSKDNAVVNHFVGEVLETDSMIMHNIGDDAAIPIDRYAGKLKINEKGQLIDDKGNIVTS